jgi:hypothetical protein
MCIYICIYMCVYDICVTHKCEGHEVVYMIENGLCSVQSFVNFKSFTLVILYFRYVEKHCHVAIIHVNKCAMLVLVENVLDLGRGSVHVRNQVSLF